jgi:DNA-binding transcriptional regulator YiaG
LKIIKLSALKIKADGLWSICMCSVNRSTHLKALRSAAAQATANVIKSARDKSELSQRALAVRLECSDSAISNIETGQRQVNVPEFIAIAEQFGEDPVKLFARVMRELRKLEQLSTATLAGWRS